MLLREILETTADNSIVIIYAEICPVHDNNQTLLL